MPMLHPFGWLAGGIFLGLGIWAVCLRDFKTAAQLYAGRRPAI